MYLFKGKLLSATQPTQNATKTSWERPRRYLDVPRTPPQRHVLAGQALNFFSFFFLHEMPRHAEMCSTHIR